MSGSYIVRIKKDLWRGDIHLGFQSAGPAGSLPQSIELPEGAQSGVSEALTALNQRIERMKAAETTQYSCKTLC